MSVHLLNLKLSILCIFLVSMLNIGNSPFKSSLCNATFMCIVSDGDVAHMFHVRNGNHGLITTVLMDKICIEILCLQKSE